MDLETFYEYCKNKKGVTEHFPFDEDILVFKVGSKIFALSSIKNWECGAASLNLKCNPEMAVDLRERFEGILPGYHMNKKHWNTILLGKGINDKLVFELIDHSYDLVFASLTKKEKSVIAL